MPSRKNDGNPSPTVVSPPRDPALDHSSRAKGRREERSRDVATSAFAGPPAELRYALGDELGRGGMGEVRACRDQHLGRLVAMKRLLEEHTSDAGVVASFIREAHIQAQLEHPSIVPVYEMGLSDGVPFLTMKRVRGTTLREVLEGVAEGDATMRERFGRHRLLAAFGAVCLAIDYAHSRAIVHRDLKPANIMLGDFGEVYVMDWGAAKVLDDADDESAIIGTPDYMAPEQLRGDAIDGRTDVYALGAILFELVTLGSFASSKGQTTAAAPDDLVAVWQKATAASPQDRFASARDLYERIERHLAGEQDIERRRTLAREHAEAAAKAMVSEPETGDAAAMRELSRALALDPENKSAMATLLRLIAEPPREVPDDVRVALDRRVAGSIADLVPFAIMTYASFLLLSPFVLWMGVRDWAASTICAVLVGATALAVVLGRRVHTLGPKSLYPALAASSIVITSASTMFGPFVFVPALLALNTLFFVIQLGRERLRSTIAIGCLPIVGLTLLQWTGVVRSSYRFSGDVMEIVPWMHALPAGATPAFLLASAVLTIVISSLFANRFRESLARAELRIELQAWKLRRLVPESDGVGD